MCLFLVEINDDFEESHKLFRNAFPEGFPWEVLKVIAGPPVVMFTWRHWAHFTGSFRGEHGRGQKIQMLGFCRATVNKDLKIEKLEVTMRIFFNNSIS